MSNNSKLDLNNQFNSWFDSSYYHILYKNRNYKEAKRFIEKIISHLKLSKKSKILDAACGKGRHSIEIEKLGYNVLGIDLSKNSIEIAKKNENDNLKFLVHDISIPLKREFNAVFNLFTSFGYQNKKKDLEIIITMEKNLKNNGIGVIDFLNINRVKKDLIKNEILIRDNIKFNIMRDINNDCVTKKISFNHNSKEYNFKEKVNALNLNNFKDYFSKTNLIIKEVFGDYQLNKYDSDSSPRLIIIFQKKIPVK
tara:strand:- start:59 stop:817 length:759 start_codon:yes stop_codon:yes gene_type:complete